MTDLLSSSEDNGRAAQTKRRAPIHREWILQAGVRRFVARAVAQPHEFAAHDRHAPRSQFVHMYEKGRGIRRDWPDTELLVPDFTFYCELKFPPNRPNDGQRDLLRYINGIPGHRAAWADSVERYGDECDLAGVPLLPNWLMIARHEDELVAGEIRKQESRTASTVAPRKRRPPADYARVARVNKIRAKVLF